MLFIRKLMETYRTQSQNFMGIKLIHVWYIPTVWCFWGIINRSSMGIKLIHVWAQTIHGTGIFTYIYKIAMICITIQLTRPQSWTACLSHDLHRTSPVAFHCNSSQHLTQLDNNSAFTPYSAWRRIVARIDQPWAKKNIIPRSLDRRFALQNPSELMVRVVMLPLHIHVYIYTSPDKKNRMSRKLVML